MITLNEKIVIDDLDIEILLKGNTLLIKCYSPISIEMEAIVPEFCTNVYRYNGIFYYIPCIYTLKDPNIIKDVLSNKVQLEIPTHFTLLDYTSVLIQFGIIPSVKSVIKSITTNRITYDKKVVDLVLQGHINSFLASSSITRYLSGNMSNNRKLIYIPNVPSLDLRFRIPWIKILPEAEIDMASISVSGKNVGLVFSPKADDVFSFTMQNVILPSHTRKVVGARSSIENSEDILNPEFPIVVGKRNDIKGTNLLAVVLTAKYNQYDAIMIRNHPDVIRQLTCIKHKTIILPTEGELLVKKNKGVNPYSPLFIDSTGKKIIFDSYRRGTVIDIEKLENRTILYIDCIYPLCDGDKLDTRNHYKGVVQLCNDDEMPLLEINNDLRLREHHKVSDTHFIPDMVVDPIGIAKRANFSLLYEMAISQSKTPNSMERKVSDPTLTNILTQGSYLLMPVKNVSCGYLYVFRPNKHAADSPIESNSITDIVGTHGWQTDSTINGARVNLTMMLVLSEIFDPTDIIEWSNIHRDLSALKPFIDILPVTENTNVC